MAKKAAPVPAKPVAAKPEAAAAAKAKKPSPLKKNPYPGLFDAEGAQVKLTELPEDYDPKAHKPLKKSDFAHDYVFMRVQAGMLQARAERMFEEALTLEKLGSPKDRVKAKKLIAMQKRMEELKAELAGEGIDLDAIMASMNS